MAGLCIEQPKSIKEVSDYFERVAHRYTDKVPLSFILIHGTRI